MHKTLIKFRSCFMKNKFRIVLIWSAIIFIVLAFVMRNKSQNDSKVFLSKNTLDELVDKAANQKYLQKVFEMPDKLPLPKHTNLKPLPEGMQTKHEHVAEQATQRCSYKGQTYVAGDIVKTDQGWIKCAPTIIFSDALDKNNNPTRQNGAPAWTTVQ